MGCGGGWSVDRFSPKNPQQHSVFRNLHGVPSRVVWCVLSPPRGLSIFLLVRSAAETEFVRSAWVRLRCR